MTLKTALILVNLGTPDAPTSSAVRRYLKEFLSDPRVVELPRLLWWPLLNGIILNTRPTQSARKYATVWTPEGSPLAVHSLHMAQKLSAFFSAAGTPIHVEHAMRYGTPALSDVLTRLHGLGYQRFIVVPLYPQYSASTTASIMDVIGDWLRSLRNQPEICMLRSFPDDENYIAALATKVRDFWQKNGRINASSRLVMSFHGLPQRAIDLGDPYFSECQQTARALAKALQLNETEYVLCFQSRFGRAKWLEPATDKTLKKLAQEGVERVDMVCPGFVADCLETLEEIALEGKQIFLQNGGLDYRMLPCLNSDAQWIEALAKLIQSRATFT